MVGEKYQHFLLHHFQWGHVKGNVEDLYLFLIDENKSYLSISNRTFSVSTIIYHDWGT